MNCSGRAMKLTFSCTQEHLLNVINENFTKLPGITVCKFTGHIKRRDKRTELKTDLKKIDALATFVIKARVLLAITTRS